MSRHDESRHDRGHRAAAPAPPRATSRLLASPSARIVRLTVRGIALLLPAVPAGAAGGAWSSCAPSRAASSPFLKAISRPAFQSAFWLTVQITAHHGARQHGLRHRDGAGPRAPALPRPRPPQRPRRPAVRALAGRHRPVARSSSTATNGWLGRVPRRPRHHGHLRGARAWSWPRIFVSPALRGARGHPGAARDRHRPGGGRLHAGRLRSGGPSGG